MKRATLVSGWVFFTTDVHRFEVAAEMAKLAGYTPEKPYPGSPDDLWPLTCATCARRRVLTLTSLIGADSFCQHGERPKRVKKLDAEMSEIVKQYEALASIRFLAKKYGVGYGTMYNRLARVTKLRPRGGDPRPGSVPKHLPVPTEAQILSALKLSRRPAETRAQVLLVCARTHHGPNPPYVTGAEGQAWARNVINYSAAMRLFDKMVRDGRIVGRSAQEWRQAGWIVTVVLGARSYYVSAARAAQIEEWAKEP